VHNYQAIEIENESNCFRINLSANRLKLSSKSSPQSGVAWCGELCCVVLCCVVLCCVVVWCGVVWCGVLSCVVLYCSVLCCVVLCYIGFNSLKICGLFQSNIYLSGLTDLD